MGILSDVDNVAHRPFADPAVRGRFVDHGTVVIHGGRPAAVKVIGGLHAEALHERCELIKAQT